LDTSEPAVTLLILNFNGKHLLTQHLASVLATDYRNFRVTIIDNGSTDGSLEFLAAHCPHVEIIRNNRNKGFVLAYNAAIASVGTEYFALLNNDVSVEPDWLKILIHHAQGKKVAALTPKMLFFHDRGRINAAGGNCDIYGTGWNRGNDEVDRGQYEKIEETFYGNGAALLISKKAWHDVGSFDERYFMYGEDVDWCWRARLKGYKILYVPSSKVYHRWLGSKGPIFYLLERNTFSNIIKNYGLRVLVKIVPTYIAIKFLKTLWAFKNAKRGGKFLALKAICWNIANFRDTWEKRLEVQSSRVASDANIQRLMVKGSFELLLWMNKISHPILESFHAG
jgi:GT2 family glycosyltransferase